MQNGYIILLSIDYEFFWVLISIKISKTVLYKRRYDIAHESTNFALR